PDDAPGLVEVALRETGRELLAADEPVDRGARVGLIVRVRQLDRRLREDLALAVAEHLAEGTVHLEEAQVRRRDHLADGRVLERAAESIVAIAQRRSRPPLLRDVVTV